MADPAMRRFKRLLGKLSDKHRIFVTTYLETYNATGAALAAGVSKASARSYGCQWLHTDLSIKAAVRAGTELVGMSAERVRDMMAEQVFGSDAAKFGPFIRGDMTLEELAASGVDTSVLTSVSVTTGKQGETRRVGGMDRGRALERIAKILGMHEFKQEATVTVLGLGGLSDAELKRMAETGKLAPSLASNEEGEDDGDN